jgi:hypothetical protein
VRTLRVLFVVILITGAIVSLGFVVARNPQNAQVDVLGNSLQTGMGVIVAIAAGIGFVVAFLLLIPGRLASAWRSWSLSRQGQDMEAKLQSLRKEHAHLQGRHQHLMEEHSQMLRQMTGAQAGPAPATVTPAPERLAAQPLQPTGPLYPSGYRPQPAAARAASTSSPSPLERLQHRFAAMKAAFQARIARMRANRARQQVEQDQRDRSPRTPAPTA